MFFVCDLATLFLAGGAFYRVYPNLGKFSEWSQLKQLHISAGILFTIFMILQHLGGASILLLGKSGAVHRKFGVLVALGMRVIAVFGWLLVKEEKVTGLCAGVAVVETIILMSIGERRREVAKQPLLFKKKD